MQISELMNSSLDPNNSFTNLNFVFLQGHYQARQSCSLTQRWTRNWINCKHTHTYTHALTRAHTHTHTHSILYTAWDDCFFFPLILLSPFLSCTCTFCLLCFPLSSLLLSFVLHKSPFLSPCCPELPRSQWVLAATAVAALLGGWRRCRGRPLPGGTSTTGGKWRWKVMAPQKRRTPLKTDLWPITTLWHITFLHKSRTHCGWMVFVKSFLPIKPTHQCIREPSILLLFSLCPVKHWRINRISLNAGQMLPLLCEHIKELLNYAFPRSSWS